MSGGSFWSVPRKERRRTRQNCHHRSPQYEETDYSLLQDNSDDDIPLQPRKSELLLEKQVEPGDNLLTLSLQFNCPVAELKRINNIHRDNEIFARRTIQIPVKPGSVAAAILAGVHTSGSSSKDDSQLILLEDTVSDKAVIPSLHGTGTVAYPVSSQDASVPGTSVLNHDNSKPILNTENWAIASSIINRLDSEPSPEVADYSDCDRVTLINPPISDQESLRLPESSCPVLKCSGADWGLTWPQLVICSLLLGFAGPIVLYVLYIKQQPK